MTIGSVTGRVKVRYRNHRGEIADRTIEPHALRFGVAEWHPGHQWLLECWDVEKNGYRTYAMSGILSWEPES